MSEILIAVDPGKTGGIAFFEDGNPVGVFQLPQDQINLSTLRDTFAKRGRTSWVVENVHGGVFGAGRKPGGSSMFIFGFGFGLVLGVAAPSPVTLVYPHIWKPAMGLTGAPKSASVELAAKIYPEMANCLQKKPGGQLLTKYHGLAEALLIGKYHLERGKT
jgi:hypothetical protein